MAPETGRFEIFDMLQTVLALMRERARSRELDIELSCPSNIGAMGADERRLKQALVNLVSNAIKFTPPGGKIRIEAERREGELMLIVADTGIGITLADQSRVLQGFGCGASRSSAGLGLSLVRSLIGLHGGTVTIDSVPGRGARVICRIPMAPPEPLGALSPAHIESRAAA